MAFNQPNLLHIYWRKIIILILCIVLCFLFSCTPPQKTFIPTTILTLTPKPILLTHPTNQLISPQLQPLTVGKISSFPLGQDGASHFTMDNQYFYWIGWTNDSYILRMAINGGKLEKIATTVYPGGRLSLFDPLLSGKWLVFADTNTPNTPDTWKIRALNLEDHSEQLIVDIKNDTAGVIYSFSMAIYDDQLVWTIGLPTSYEDSISMMNLTTGEKREVARKKEDGSLWSLIGVSAGKAVVEQDFDEKHGNGTDMFLLDLETGKNERITTDGMNAMPRFSYPWAAWKANNRYDDMAKLAIYNTENHVLQYLPLLSISNTDPQINGSNVYWKGWPNNSEKRDAIYIFDAGQNTLYTMNILKGDERFDDIYLNGKLLAWVRVISSNPNADSYLEWTAIK